MATNLPVDITTNEGVFDDIAGFLVSSSNTQVAAQEAAKKSEVIAKDTESIYRDIARSQASVSYQEETAKLQAQNATRRAALAAGVNPMAGVDSIIEMMSQLQVTNQKLTNNIKTINRSQEVKFLDNPVDWIGAQIDSAFARKDLETNVASAGALQNSLAAVNSAVQSTARTQDLIKESLTEATIQDRVKIAAADALLKANSAALEGIKYNQAAISAARDASLDRLNVLFQAKNARDSETRLQLNLQEAGLSRERFNWQKAEKDEADAIRKEVKDAKLADKKIDDNVIELINLSKAALGQPTISVEEAATELRLFKSGQSKELQFHFNRGREIRMTGAAIVGRSPAESLTVIEGMPTNFPDIKKDTALLILEAKKVLSETKDPRLLDPKNEEGRNSFINKYVKDIVAEQFSNITPGNMFDVGDLSSYIGLSGVNSLPVVTKVLQPLAEAKQPLSDPKVVIGLTAKAVKDGVISSSEAQNLAQIYRKASLINQSARDFTAFGIVLPNNGMNYYVRVGGMFGGRTDMTNPAEIGRFLSQTLTEEMMGARRGGTPNSMRRLMSGANE